MLVTLEYRKSQLLQVKPCEKGQRAI